MKRQNSQEMASYQITSLITGTEELSFAKVQILSGENQSNYVLSESEMEPDEKEIYYKIISILKETDSEKNLLRMNRTSAINYILNLLKKEGVYGKYQINRLGYFIYKNYAGFGKIESLMLDPEVKYIFCEGIGFPVYVFHSNPKYNFLKTNIAIKSISEFKVISDSIILKSRKLREDDGFLGVLYDKYITEVSSKSGEFSIKKINKMPVFPRDLVQLNVATPQIMSYLKNAINQKASLLILGGNPRQRTELLNSLSMMVEKDTKTISFENYPKLIITQDKWYSKILKLYTKNKEYVIENGLRKKPGFVIADDITYLKQIIKNIKNGCQTFISFDAQTFDEAMEKLNKTVPTPNLAFIDIVVVLSSKKEDWPEINTICELHSYDIKTKKIQVRPFFYTDSVTNKKMVGKSKLFSQIF